MNRPKPPCILCENRSEGCHSKCEEYEEYRLAHKKYRDDLREIKGKQFSVDSYFIAKKKRGKALEATDQISTMYHGVEMMPKGVFEQIYKDDDAGYEQGWNDGYAYGIGGEDDT